MLGLQRVGVDVPGADGLHLSSVLVGGTGHMLATTGQSERAEALEQGVLDLGEPEDNSPHTDQHTDASKSVAAVAARRAVELRGPKTHDGGADGAAQRAVWYRIVGAAGGASRLPEETLGERADPVHEREALRNGCS